ncbi:hypothetical protein [Pseudomonas sp. C1C7]|nr:hypothetical protein [Pseudomonas sp. C1C7]
MATINRRMNDEKPFIGEMFQLVSGTHQIPNPVSDILTVNQ